MSEEPVDLEKDSEFDEPADLEQEGDHQLDERTKDLHIATNIIAGDYARGQTVAIRGVTLKRWIIDGNIWAVYNEDGQFVDSVQAGRARSAKEFLKFVDETLAEDESRWAV
jgi:hypothetical protein